MLAPLVAGIVAALIIIAGGTWYFLAGNRSAPVAATAPAARLSMVVLPFANLSGDASQDYFADGITESLTTDLSRLSGAFVIVRNTAFTFKGKPADAKQIGADLGVRYVLEGSVQRDAARLRVNAQLIDAETGNHLWAERFDKPLAILLDMQDEIVARLANQLGAQLIAAEARRTKTAPNPDSMDLYFQGMALINSGAATLELLEQARGFFVRALALDASNVDAMVGLGRVDFVEAAAYLVEDRTAHFAAAEATLNKVFAVAPNNAWAHVWMGDILNGTNRAPRALAELDRALALDPNLAYAYGERATSLIFLGRAEEVELQANQALRLSPRDNFAFVWMVIAGAAKIHLGADDQAEAWLRQSIVANPNFPFGHIFLAAALANLGKLAEARVEARAGLALNPKFTVHRFQLGAESDNSVFLAQRQFLLEGMRKAGLPEE